MTIKSGSSASSVVTIDMERTSCDDKSSARLMINKCTSSPVSVTDWGFPGYLTAQEYATFKRFREEVARRDDEFEQAIFSFGFEEEERFALCRWLRARKFDLPAVIKMVESAVQARRDPAKHNFYPDAKIALLVEPSVFISQYPQLYCSQCKEGYPLFFSKPGVLNVSGLECITTMQGLLNYHWHAMVHAFGGRLRVNKKADANFQRFEVVCIIDLENLAVSNVGKRPLNLIKLQSEIDSLCFPETLHKFLIINAPSAFSMIWNIIKNWIDSRTRAKVEIYSLRTQWEPRLLKLVHKKELPSDYGGTGAPTVVRLKDESTEPGVLRQYIETLNVCKSATAKVMEVKEGEEIELFVMTRSLREGEFRFCFLSGYQLKNAFFSSPWTVKHIGKGIDEENPTRVTFPRRLRGPCKFQLKINCNTGTWSSESFLVAAKVRNILHASTHCTKNKNKGTIESSNRDSRSSSQSTRIPKITSNGSIDPFDSDFVVTKVCHNKVDKSSFLPNTPVVATAESSTSSTSGDSCSSTVLETSAMSQQDDFAFSGCLGWSCGAFWK